MGFLYPSSSMSLSHASAFPSLSADLGFSCVGIVGLVVGGLVGAAVVLLVVVLLLKVGAGLRVTTTCVGAALGLRVVVACLGVGLAGLLWAAGVDLWEGSERGDCHSGSSAWTSGGSCK